VSSRAKPFPDSTPPVLPSYFAGFDSAPYVTGDVVGQEGWQTVGEDGYLILGGSGLRSNGNTEHGASQDPITVDCTLPWRVTVHVIRTVVADNVGYLAIVVGSSAQTVGLQIDWAAGGGATGHVLDIQASDSTGALAIAGPLLWSVGSPHEVVWEWDGTNLTIALDGVQVLSPTPFASTPFTNGTQLYGFTGTGTDRITLVDYLVENV
jgi:hypothetical protein